MVSEIMAKKRSRGHPSLNLKLKISEISSLQIPTDDVVWVLSDLISISGAIENLFAGQSEFNQGDNFPAS